MKIIKKQGSEFPGYKKVDYIEYNGTQQINTGVYPDDTTVVQCKFVMTHYNGDAFIGSKGTGESNSFRFFRAGDGKTYLDYGSGLGGNRISGTYITSTTAIYECEFGNKYVKDLTTGTIKFSGSTVSFNEKTFTIKIGDTLEYGIIYWCKIYKGGVLVRDYIPVISDSTNTVGLLDKVNMIFYTDVNNNSFTYGQIIDEEDKYYCIKKLDAVIKYYGIKSQLVPSRYEVVDYLEYTGSLKPYIKTGVLPTNRTKIEIDVTPIDTNNSSMIGSDTSWLSNGCFEIGEATAFNTQYKYSCLSENPSVINTRAILILSQDGLYKNGTKISSFSTVSDFTGIELYLFAWNRNGAANDRFRGRVYSCKIYSDYQDDSSIIRNFVPVYDTQTQKYGMYDIVGQQFYGNLGTDDFTGGND